MPTPQPAIFTLGTSDHWFLQFQVPDSADLDTLAQVVAEVRDEASQRGVNSVVACGPGLSARWFGAESPAGFRPFATVAGEMKEAPSTQDDLLVWLHSGERSANFDIAQLMTDCLDQEGVASLLHEIPGWVYLDSRDLTGFIDGTANPSPDEAPGVAVVPEGRPGAGGSFVIGMRWVHDLATFEHLAVADQEAVMGRTKPDSVELDPKPADSHVGRVEIADESGEELAIFRRSVPYGSLNEPGLFFLAFCHDQSIFDLMLARMFGTTGDGVHDRLIEFTTPVTGSYYYAPPVELLERPTPDR
jgi:putative iron-dependent peroxidase